MASRKKPKDRPGGEWDRQKRTFTDKARKKESRGKKELENRDSQKREKKTMYLRPSPSKEGPAAVRRRKGEKPMTSGWEGEIQPGEKL